MLRQRQFLLRVLPLVRGTSATRRAHAGADAVRGALPPAVKLYKSLAGATTEALRFCAVGLLNTSVTLGIIWSLMAIGSGPYAANLCGYAIGMVISFTLHRNWTFQRGNGSKSRQIVLFLIASGLAYISNLTAVAGLLGCGVEPYLSQLLGMPAYTVTFFLLSKFVVFETVGSEH